jgi:hypothetical protein
VFDWIKRLGQPKVSRLQQLVGDETFARIEAARSPETIQVEDAFSPMPADCGEEGDGSRSALVAVFVGTDQELEPICQFHDDIDLPGEMTDEEASMARNVLLSHLEDLAEEFDIPEFTFDTSSSMHVASNGDRVAVYVVRGSAEALDQFNKSVAAVGGELDTLGVEGVNIAADAFANIVRSECEWAEDQADRDAVDLADALSERVSHNLGAMELKARIGKLEAKRSRGYLKQAELDELIDYRVAQRLMNIGMDEVQDATASLEELGFGSFTPDDLEAWKNAVAKNHARMLVWTPFRPFHNYENMVAEAFDVLRGAGSCVTFFQGLDQSEEVAQIKEWAQEWNDAKEAASWAASPVKHRSPCYLRRKERQKFGVREAQLLKNGANPEAAVYISDRVKHMQRQGVGMVAAIEQAQTEWLVREGQWDGLDLLNRRREVGLTVPRLVVDGYGSEHAQFLIGRVDYFGSEGVPLSEALNWAHYLWEAKQSGEAVEMRAAKDRIYGWLRSVRVQQIVNRIAAEDDLEEMSGAVWIAEVAADLCEEWNCKTSALFTREEALDQAWTEWWNMSPEARTSSRIQHYLDCGVDVGGATASAKAEEAKRFPVIEAVPPAPPEFDAKEFFREVVAALVGLDPSHLAISAPSLGIMPAPFDYVSGCCDGCDQELEKDLDVTLAVQEQANLSQAVRQAVRVRELQLTKEERQSPDAWKLLYIAGLKVRGFSTEEATWLTNRRGVLGDAGFTDKEAVAAACNEFNRLSDIDPSGQMTMAELFTEESKYLAAYTGADEDEFQPGYVAARLSGMSRFSSAERANGR